VEPAGGRAAGVVLLSSRARRPVPQPSPVFPLPRERVCWGCGHPRRRAGGLPSQLLRHPARRTLSQPGRYREVRVRFGLRLRCLSSCCPEAADLLSPSSSSQLPLLQQLIAVVVGPHGVQVSPYPSRSLHVYWLLACFEGLHSSVDLFVTWALGVYCCGLNL
jgi:hypothetical protein